MLPNANSLPAHPHRPQVVSLTQVFGIPCGRSALVSRCLTRILTVSRAAGAGGRVVVASVANEHAVSSRRRSEPQPDAQSQPEHSGAVSATNWSFVAGPYKYYGIGASGDLKLVPIPPRSSSHIHLLGYHLC